MKHTPGPWTVDRGSDDRIRGENVTVALVTRGVDDDPDNELGGPTFEANARLIAAAPDLLLALKAAAIVIRTWHGMGMGPAEEHAWSLYQASPEMTTINAAIAKAEGKP